MLPLFNPFYPSKITMKWRINNAIRKYFDKVKEVQSAYWTTFNLVVS